MSFPKHIIDNFDEDFLISSLFSDSSSLFFVSDFDFSDFSFLRFRTAISF